MKLKNVSARKVSCNYITKKGVATVNFLPAENPLAVEVPKEALKSDFIKSLIKDGTLVDCAKEEKEAAEAKELEELEAKEAKEAEEKEAKKAAAKK